MAPTEAVSTRTGGGVRSLVGPRTRTPPFQKQTPLLLHLDSALLANATGFSFADLACPRFSLQGAERGL